MVEGQGEGEGQGQRVLVFGLRSVSGCRWLLRCVAGQQPPASEIESAGVGRGGERKKKKVGRLCVRGAYAGAYGR